MRLLNRTTQKIRFFRGNATGINSNLNILGLEGEPLYATDDKELYMHDGTSYVPVRIFQKPARLKGYTVATLPTGTIGDIAYVTDALAPTYLTVVVGGGAIVSPVFFDGTNWVAHQILFKYSVDKLWYYLNRR